MLKIWHALGIIGVQQVACHLGSGCQSDVGASEGMRHLARYVRWNTRCYWSISFWFAWRCILKTRDILKIIVIFWRNPSRITVKLIMKEMLINSQQLLHIISLFSMSYFGNPTSRRERWPLLSKSPVSWFSFTNRFLLFALDLEQPKTLWTSTLKPFLLVLWGAGNECLTHFRPAIWKYLFREHQLHDSSHHA